MPSVLAQRSVTPYIVVNEPIGYAQSYVALGSGDDRGRRNRSRKSVKIQSSLNASQLGKGLGTKLVRALVELAFNDPEVTKIQRTRRRATCERSDATEKAGFERRRYRN